jgi:hypothetical protein
MCARILLAIGLLALTPACSPVVGDACEVSADCGRSLICDLSMPDGYCTLESCEQNGCPGEGICIRFTPDISYCMQPCEANSDCRSGYTCVQDFGVHPFCNDARGEPPAGDAAE